jgi:hypothetical protein
MRSNGSLLAAWLVACSVDPPLAETSTEDATGDARETEDGSSGTTSGSPGSETTEDEGASSGGSTGEAEPIGMLIETGTRTIDESTSNPPACDDLCAALGGWCDDASAGRSYYECGPSSHGGRFYSCAWPEEVEYYDAEGNLCRLVEYACECHDVPVEDPTVEVLAEEGLFACDEVCRSWDLTCDGGGGTYDAFGDALTPIDCSTPPGASAYRYVCLCSR